MAILKAKDIAKMSEKERTEKFQDLKMELVKTRASEKSKLKPKEIKRAIARLLTFNRLNKESVEK